MGDWLGRIRLRGTSHDRQRLSESFIRYKITPAGPFKAVLDGDWEPAWRYVAWAVKRYPDHPGLVRKLKKLNRIGPRKGSSSDLVKILKNDYEACGLELNSRYVRSESGDQKRQLLGLMRNSERGWATGLLEFKAFYVLAELGYAFVDADVRVGGTGRNRNKDCDWLMEKGGQRFRVDVRRWCGDTDSLEPLPGGIGRRFNPGPSFTWEVGKWLRDQCEEVGLEKRADILVCDLPGGRWEIGEFSPPSSRSIRAYSDQILPDALRWSKSGPTWVNCVPRRGVVQIIIVKPKVWWLIRVDRRPGLNNGNAH